MRKLVGLTAKTGSWPPLTPQIPQGCLEDTPQIPQGCLEDSPGLPKVGNQHYIWKSYCYWVFRMHVKLEFPYCFASCCYS